MLVDTHSHIFVQEFDLDREQTIARAAEVGVQKFILPNIDSSSIPRLLETSQAFPSVCFPLMGLHPTSVGKDFEKELEVVEDWLTQHKFYGIGEIGIDLYWDKTYVEQQKEAFAYQIRLAKKHNLPIVIHARNSFDEIFEVLDKENDSALRGVFHSFTGGEKEYKRIMSYGGFILGLGGVVTYKNGGVDKVVPLMDTSEIILETDSPYLSPVPNRGKRNEPANLIYTAKRVADLLNVDIQHLASATTANAIELFGITSK